MLQPARSSVTTKLPPSSISGDHTALHGVPAGSNSSGMVNCPPTASPMVEVTVSESSPSANTMRSTNAPGGASTVISDFMLSDSVTTVFGGDVLIAVASSSSNTNSADSTTSCNISQSSASVPIKSSECTKAKRPPSSPMTGTVSKLSGRTCKTSSKSNWVSTKGTARMGVQDGTSNSSAGRSHPLNTSSETANIKAIPGAQGNRQ